jgi:hypothetical protein
MRRLKTILASLIILALFSVYTFASASAPKMTLTANRLGPFKIGMTMAEVNTHLTHKLVAGKPDLRATQGCDYINVNDLAGTSFVFINDRLVRIDLDAPGIKSRQGLEVGENLHDALPELRDAKREPLDHVPDGSSFVIETPQQRNAMSFQFEHGRLVRIIAGDKKVIRFSEGCD